MEAIEQGKTKTIKRRLFPAIRKMRRLIRLLWPHAKNYKGLLFTGAAISIALIVLRLAQPWPLKWIIDILSEGYTSLEWLQLSSEQAIVLFSIVYIVVALLAGVSNYWQTILLSGLGNRVIYNFRNRAFDHLFRLPLEFHQKKTVGELVTRIVYDTSRLRRGVNGILIRSIQVFFTFLLNVIVILLLNWQIAIIFGVVGGLALLLMNRNGKRILSEARKNRRREGQLASVVSEDMHGIREFQTFRPENSSDARFDRKNVKSLSTEQKVRRIAAKMTTQVEVLLAAGICVVLWVGAIAVQSGDLSVGSLVLISYYAVGLIGPFRQFARQAAQTGRTIAVAERLTRIIKTEATITDAPDAVELTNPPQTIQFSDVSIKNSRKNRTSRKWLLNNIDLNIKQGEKIAVIGKNGAGKSTLFKLLLRLSDPQLGTILIEDIDIKKIKLASLRNMISVVFQDSIFFGLTLRENIAFGKADATTEEIEHCLSECKIDDWAKGLKNGIETPIQRQGAAFSGGEKQKIAIARALLRNGDIWLLDEPTNELDEKSKRDLTKLLLEVTNNKTTFWITHDQTILKYFTRVLLLDEGKIEFIGTPEEFSSYLKNKVEEKQIVDQLFPGTNRKEEE